MKLLLLGIAYFLFVTFAPVAVIAWLGPISVIAIISFVVMAVKSSRK